jgi:hypothetical protein
MKMNGVERVKYESRVCAVEKKADEAKNNNP